jgi:glycosyltransferase involved in cell wall biosynthesis
MLHGAPVIASDLPGIRSPVQQTGMGEVFPAGNAQAFAEAVIRVLQARQTYLRPRAEIEQHYHIERTVDAYERTFEDLVTNNIHS